MKFMQVKSVFTVKVDVIQCFILTETANWGYSLLNKTGAKCVGFHEQEQYRNV